MNNELERYIASNRETFDDAVPPANLFEKIQEKATRKKRGRKHLNLKIAASLLVAVSLATFFILKGKNRKETPATETLAEYDTTIYGDPIYAKQIYHFREIIGLKQSELKQLEKEYPQLYNTFVGDISKLDSSYQSLKVDLAGNPNRELLLEAMLRNLQLQSELLNRQLMIIKEIKQKHKKPSHEKNTA